MRHGAHHDARARRTRRRPWEVALATLVVVLGTMVQPALADVRTEARRHFRRGMTLIQEGSVDEGVAELQEAYEILPHPNVLYNIGRAYAEAGRYDEALEYFEQYLASDPPDREEVQGFVRAVEQRIAAERVAQTETPAEGETVEPGETPEEQTPQLEATTEEIEALREAATQIETLAAATQSDALRARAQRLREVADHLSPSEGPAEGGGAEGGAGEGEGLALGESSEDLYEESVVSASRFAQSPLDAPNAISVVTRQDIRMTGITHIGELIRRVAGADVMRMTASHVDIGIRGFNQRLSPRVLVLIDGRSTYIDPFGTTFFGLLEYAVEDIERIEIIRGPASALYGADAFGGVINIITREPGSDPGTEVTLGAGNQAIYRGHVASSGRTGNLRYRLAAGYEQMNEFRTLDLDRQDVTFVFDNPELGLRKFYSTANLRYRVSRDVSLYAEGGVSLGRQTIPGAGPTRDISSEGPLPHVNVGVQSSWGQLRFFWNRMQVNQSGRVAFDPFRTELTFDVYDIEGEIAREFHLGIDHNFHIGGAYRRKSMIWDLLGPGRVHENHGNVFLSETARFTDRFSAVVSVRMDKHPLIADPVWSPRAALVAKPTERSAFRLSGGRAFRTQTFLESYFNTVNPSPITGASALGTGSATDRAGSLGQPALAPEQIISAELGYRNMESDYFDVELSAYYNRVTDLVVFRGLQGYTYSQIDEPDSPGYLPASATYILGATGFRNDPSTFDVIGAEANVRANPVQGLDLWGNYTFNRTFVGGQTERENEERTSRHKLNIGVQYRAPFGLDVSVDVHYVTRQTWLEQDFDSAGGVIFVSLDLPAYYLINARVGWRLLDDRLNLGVVGYNITNNEHREHPLGQLLSVQVMGTLSYRF